jgi:phage terminase large subunit-like protein
MRPAQLLSDARREGWSAWIRRPCDEQAVLEGCRFEIRAAERVRTFFDKFLRHSKGQWAGQRFQLLDWQWREIVAPLFGWKRADGSRRYRRGYFEVPKKNGKSTLFSGLSLYLLAGDGEAGAEVYNAAVDRDQASIVFNEAANMVEVSSQLSARLNVVRSTKRIVMPGTRSFYKALSRRAALASTRMPC